MEDTTPAIGGQVIWGIILLLLGALALFQWYYGFTQDISNFRVWGALILGLYGIFWGAGKIFNPALIGLIGIILILTGLGFFGYWLFGEDSAPPIREIFGSGYSSVPPGWQMWFGIILFVGGLAGLGMSGGEQEQ